MRIVLIITFWLALVSVAVAQNETASLLTTPPDNCEGNSARLEAVRNRARATGENQVIIAIARLGTNERMRELNGRRLYTVRAYLTAMGLPSYKLVTAEGTRAEGYGRVEIYVSGELIEVFTANPCKDLPVGICDNDLEDRRRYQLPYRINARRCK